MPEPANKQLYEKVKNEVYKKYPKHSLYRSALMVKLYKAEGGTYKDGEPKEMNIKKWFKQNWISLNDWLRGQEVKCGNSDTQKKYNEYPLCRPKAIAEKLSKPQIIDMIKEKNKLKEKPLKTEKVIKSKKLNIKTTKKGI